MAHDPVPAQADVAGAVRSASTALGIELGSTRIKACLIGPDRAPLATSSYDWENRFVDRIWTYPLDAVWEGLSTAFARLADQVEARYGAPLTNVGALGISAMMHGYLAFDAAGELLVPFRTWRNTTTERAASELTQALGFNFPVRWSASHLYQAVLDEEPHVPRLSFITTLAGYVHWKLTGRKALGVGDASGMFPVDPGTHSYDAVMLGRFQEMVAAHHPGLRVADLLPEVLVAGQDAGRLSREGALLLDPTGALQPGVPLCPPEGDAGTGMVATNSVAPRTGNISAGTSIFAMVVLEKPLGAVHPEVDIVTTPAGAPVAMVHCNNGASELDGWARLFGELAAALGEARPDDVVFRALFEAALDGEPDGGGLLAYNYLSGEPITGMAEGRPLFVRAPDSRLTLANFMRAQIYSAFATLSLGMRTLAEEGVEVGSVFAHGGLFRTAGVAQRLLAAALGVPVIVAGTASEGGAWGTAVLADYLMTGGGADLATHLRTTVFAGAAVDVVAPDQADAAGFATFLDRYRAGLGVERAATEALK